MSEKSDASLAATAAFGTTTSTQKISMDLDLGYADLAERQVYLRAVGYFIWIYAVLLAAFLDRVRARTDFVHVVIYPVPRIRKVVHGS